MYNNIMIQYRQPFNGLFSGTTWLSWHQDHVQIIYTSLQTDNHASTSSLNFFLDQTLFLMPNQQCQSTECMFNMTMKGYKLRSKMWKAHDGTFFQLAFNRPSTPRVTQVGPASLVLIWPPREGTSCPLLRFFDTNTCEGATHDQKY